MYYLPILHQYPLILKSVKCLLLYTEDWSNYSSLFEPFVLHRLEKKFTHSSEYTLARNREGGEYKPLHNNSLQQ